MSREADWERISELAGVDGDGNILPPKIMVRDSRGLFTFEEWQNLPPEVPPPLKPWWRD